jgi:DNA-binding beta-propeller fold protein YncE
MAKWWLVFCVWLALSTGTVYAQEPLAPISTLEAGDFRALALTADGDRLLVADAENLQVRIYNFNDPAEPTLLTSLDVSGAPVLLAGGANFGLVAEQTDNRGSDLLEVIAPAIPSPRAEFVAGRLFIDIAKNPQVLALSPDQRWGVVVGEDAYTVLLINSVDDIESLTVEGNVSGVALSNTTAYVLHNDLLIASPLASLDALQTEGPSLQLNGTPSAVALNASATQGVVVVDGTRLLMFDPATMAQTGEFTVEGAPITSIQYLNKERRDLLLVTREGANDITLLDAADPSNQSDLSATASLDNPITALTTFDPFIVVTDGVTIRIFSA